MSEGEISTPTAVPNAGAEAEKCTMENAPSSAESHVPYTVTSPISPEGKTLTTSNIGTTIYESPVRTDLSGVSQLPTVYLPPIHYTYDRATGKLIQINQGERGPMPIPPTTSVHANTVSTINATPLSPVKSSTNNINIDNATCTTTTAPHLTPRLGQSYTSHISQITRPMYTINDPNSTMRQMPQYDFNNLPQVNIGTNQVMQQPITGTYTTQFTQATPFKNTTYINSYAPQVMRNYTSELGPQPTFDGHPQMGYTTTDPQRTTAQPGHHIGGAQAFASTMQKTYDSAANVFRTFDNVSMSNVTQGIKSVLHPGSTEYMKAAVFKLQRLENIPLTAHASNKVAYSVVAYFDEVTENYGVYKSPQRWAIASEHPHLAHCDLRGDLVKIPWQGEQYVYLKVVEHLNQLETVVGRLKLHIESLVRQHPLRVSIISDNNAPSGHILLEFNTGHMSYHEMREVQEETMRSAERRQKFDYQFRTNRMPDYETYVQQHKALQRDKMAAEYAPGQSHYRPRAHPSTLGEVQIPAALNHFVRWCCDITDSDLY